MHDPFLSLVRSGLRTACAAPGKILLEYRHGLQRAPDELVAIQHHASGSDRTCLFSDHGPIRMPEKGQIGILLHRTLF